MRNDLGWFVWWWELGPFTFGLDLTTWGVGFLFALRFPRGFSAHAGPFYLTMEGSALEEWMIRKATQLEKWMDKREAAAKKRRIAKLEAESQFSCNCKLCKFKRMFRGKTK
jgi:hypothetical protein